MSHPSTIHPLVFKGRGAVSRPEGRFNRLTRSSEPCDATASDEAAAGVLATQVSVEATRSIISRNQSPDIFFEQSANPYRGCEHGCTYCYARPNHAYLGLSPGLDFETRLVAKPQAAQALRRELSAPGYRCSPIVLGTATDAYQPIERKHGITRQLVQLLAQCGHPMAVITKSSLIERDLDLLAPMAEQRLAAVYISLATLDADLARRWEPRAPAPWRRLQTIRRLSQAGVPVGVMLAPIVPFLNEPEIEQILDQAAQAGARSAHFTVLRLPLELEQVFTDWLRQHFPLRADRVLARLAEMRPGGLNDARFHHRMRGQGKWAELIRMRFELACRKLGLARERPPLDTSRFQPPDRPSQMSLFGA